jgi:DNA polymerase-4
VPPATPVPTTGPPAHWVLHVDLDEFLAAVEVARRPELAGRPVIVGGDGDPTRRGVVATASYAARAFGVGSGMALRTAAKRCPEAVFLPSDPPAYDAASERVMAVLRRFGVVEVLGWDEAFLAGHTAVPEALAADVRRAVEEGTGLVCSVGIGDNRLRAKVATGFAKPAGTFRLTKHNWVEVMGDRRPEELWGVGARTAAKLRAMGINTVLELARTDPAVLAARFGPTMGPWYRMMALGIGGTEVSDAPHQAKGRSREVTFQEDVADRARMDAEVARLARRVAEDVAEEGRPAVRIGVKVRFVPFVTQTRSVTLDAPTADPDTIERAALDVLTRFRHSRPVRLLGVRAELAPAAQKTSSGNI